VTTLLEILLWFAIIVGLPCAVAAAFVWYAGWCCTLKPWIRFGQANRAWEAEWEQLQKRLDQKQFDQTASSRVKRHA
jgi:hypothetical protein